MAAPQSKNKERLIEFLILAFVIVSVSLLVVQLGMNVSDTLDQSRVNSGQTQPNDLTLTPLGPTPTIDFSLPVSEINN